MLVIHPLKSPGRTYLVATEQHLPWVCPTGARQGLSPQDLVALWQKLGPLSCTPTSLILAPIDSQFAQIFEDHLLGSAHGCSKLS